jgi:hypothetical protein
MTTHEAIKFTIMGCVIYTGDHLGLNYSQRQKIFDYPDWGAVTEFSRLTMFDNELNRVRDYGLSAAAATRLYDTVSARWNRFAPR